MSSGLYDEVVNMFNRAADSMQCIRPVTILCRVDVAGVGLALCWWRCFFFFPDSLKIIWYGRKEQSYGKSFNAARNYHFVPKLMVQ